MKRRIHWETVFMMLLFAISVLFVSIVVFSSLCLTYTGTVLFFITIILIGYSGIYLYDRYENTVVNYK